MLTSYVATPALIERGSPGRSSVAYSRRTRDANVHAFLVDSEGKIHQSKLLPTLLERTEK